MNSLHQRENLLAEKVFVEKIWKVALELEYRNSSRYSRLIPVKGCEAIKD